MDPLEQDQEDFHGRASADAFFADVTVLLERKGDVENEILRALSTLNEKSGKLGSVAIVLMPEIVPSEPDASGPEYFVQQSVQCVSQALLNDGDTGSGKSAEQIGTRLRQLFHRFSGGLGTWAFAGMEPIPADAGKVSYVARFRRLARDEELPKCGLPLLDPDAGVAPQTVTMTTATSGAAIYYTTDGSLPTPTNGTLYAGAVEIAAPATVRAVAYKTGLLASDVAMSLFT